jgi:hypothetical protein
LVGRRRWRSTPAADITAIEADVSTNLLDWSKLTGGTTLTNGMLWIQDPAATNHLMRYYRVVERVSAGSK